MTFSWQHTTLESLDVGAAPLVRHFLARLQLVDLFEQHLPTLPGRQPALSTALTLEVLLTNLLLARQPLYAIPAWATRRVPEHLGLHPDQLDGLNDDRIGRALDHLDRADRASLLTALVLRVVREFEVDMTEFHQDTTTVTFSGDYAQQPEEELTQRPPRITFGYNKDHRPDLKQLLYNITISADGAVPIHCKVHDGNTSDDQVHQETWTFLKQIVGHSNFLYVADSKLCTRENMNYIAGQHGRFLTVMPRTRAEVKWFSNHIQQAAVDWVEVHREPHPRRKSEPDVVYHGVESPQCSSEGYRVLWYRSSQKQQLDREARQHRLQRARARWDQMQAAARRGLFATAEEARQAGERFLEQERVQDWLGVTVEEDVQEHYQQVGPGRPGPETAYRRVERVRYRFGLREDAEALARAGRCDGLFPLMTNDTGLTVREALHKYKYQPFAEKRHEQLKNMFAVAPMWLKNVNRISSVLWLYYVVELVGALVERELRRRMVSEGVKSLALYPEGRPSTAPTTELVWNVLEGHRRHRLLDGNGRELHRYYDELTDPARQVLELLGVDLAPYGLEGE